MYEGLVSVCVCLVIEFDWCKKDVKFFFVEYEKADQEFKAAP